LNSTVLSTIIKKLETFQINLQVLKDRLDRGAQENNNGGATRYFVIGSRDNFDWMSLKDT
jgi:hypothetical protein